MAHECPECGQTCYCRGDIDDLLLNDEDAVIHCNHWLKCDPDDDDLYDEEPI